MVSRIVIIGAGGHGRAVAEIVLMSEQFDLVGFVDDAKSREPVFGKPILGPIADIELLRSRTDCVFVAVGANIVRERIHQMIRERSLSLAAAIMHPSAIVSSSARIGPGVAIMAGSLIGTEAQLGEGAIVNSGAVVDHHCVVECFGHLGTNATMAGGSVLGRGAWMQAGASLGYGVRVASGTVLRVGEALQAQGSV